MEFNIELSDVIIPEKCPILGITLKTHKKVQYNSPSLDRIDNSFGYVKGNVCVISFKANTLKGNGSIEDFEKILSYMKNVKTERTRED